MEISRRTSVIYGLLLGVWVLVAGWQLEEHVRVKEAARTDLRNRSREIANTLSATIRGMRFRGAVLQNQLEPVLNELISDRTNELVKSSELISIVLLNTAGEPVVAAGKPIDLSQQDLGREGERWGQHTVTFVNPIEGASLTNATVVLPPRENMTNTVRAPANTNSPDRSDHERDHREGNSRPRWARWMDQSTYEAMLKRELHGLVLAMSTENLESLILHDIWLRCVILFFAGISAIGVSLAWRNLARTSELQIRLIRASEMNTHLKEMNLAAAGLAHETRNPLNIIRGMAQMLSKQTDTPPEIREKTRAIVDETDKVTAQLNEFINYSRPREIRRSTLALTPAVNEVVRALNYDLEEKKVKLEVKGDSLSVEADEQLFRQALFNLLLNAVQAVDTGGEIQVVAEKQNASEAVLEVRDNGPGVPPDRRKEIFKPYFTTHQKGTGLGLAVVQQIVLAHGWEIECFGNDSKGAVFRITHLKIAE